MISSAQEKPLQALLSAFLAENAKLNLSALRTEDACWVGNILDSVALLEMEEGLGVEEVKLLDIGTGGGFPLLPLAICQPEWLCSGLDSTQKKLDAIGRIAEEMNLSNVTLVNGRTEDLGHDPAHREHYDVVTARAVAPLNTLLEYAAPFAKVNGYIVAWKSVHIEEELAESLAARSALHCHLIKTHEYTLPGDWGTRQLLIFQKTNPTDAMYPRENGIPKKHPIV